MNISRLGSLPASALPAGAKAAPAPTRPEEAEKGVGTGPHATHHDVHEPEPLHGQRIANFVDGISKRVAHALEHGALSTDQVQALKDAAQQFSALMNRIDNADMAASPKRQVHFALHQLGQAFQGILHPDGGDPSAPASDAAAPTAPSIDTTA